MLRIRERKGSSDYSPMRHMQAQVRSLVSNLANFIVHLEQTVPVAPIVTICSLLACLAWLVHRRSTFRRSTFCGIVVMCAALLIYQLQTLPSAFPPDTPGVAVLGEVGVGKSTFCTIVASCLAGMYQLKCAAGNGVGSFTDVESEHVFNSRGRSVHWRFRDTPGDIVNVRSHLRIAY
jgi:hypothetical protein